MLHLLLQPGWETTKGHQPNWDQEGQWSGGILSPLCHSDNWWRPSAFLCSFPALRVKKKKKLSSDHLGTMSTEESVPVSWENTSSPKFMTSTLTFSFLSRFAILISYEWEQKVWLFLLHTCRKKMEQNETHFFFIILYWAANKHNNAHLVVFPLSVLQRQLQEAKAKSYKFKQKQ